MPTQTDELLAEVAEAAAAGLRAEELSTLRGQVEGSSTLPDAMSYHVPDSDAAAWIAAYRLSIDHAGVERGEPTKLAKGALGMYLGKRRPVDGGRLFSLKMPEHLIAQPTFACFAAPNFCKHKSDTKHNLLDHIEASHPREATHLKDQIEMIRASANRENSALQALVDNIADTPDPGSVVVPKAMREVHNAAVVEPVAPVATVISVTPRCVLCPWPEGAAKWANTPPTQQALRMHIFAKHKDSIE